MTRVALYLRQSKDADGNELAIDRQRAGCLDRAASKGWSVAAEDIYIDNNVSATSERARPAYVRLVAAVKARKYDVVIAWNLDRLTRKPREIEDWIDLNHDYGVNLMTSEGDDPIDLSTESGRLILRINAAVARQEVERKGRRQKESNAQSRQQGLPPNGRRAFGYTHLKPGAKAITTTREGRDGHAYPDYGHEPVTDEARAIARGFRMLLEGATLGSIARSWNADGLTTTDGKEWGIHAVRGVLSNPRYAALVAPPRDAHTTGHRASRYDLGGLTEGTWEPIVSRETWAAALEVLRDPSRRKLSGAPRRWLLSGIATCGVCGAPMKAGATRGKVPTYRCSASNHLARKADPADELVEWTAVQLILREGVRLLDDNTVADADVLRARERELERTLRNVEDYYAALIEAGDLTPAEAATKSRARRGRLRADLADVRRELSDAGKVDVLGGLVEAGAEDGTESEREARVVAAWASMPTELQRRAVDALMAVSMTSPGKGSRATGGTAGRLAHTRRSVHLVPRASAAEAVA